MNHSFYFKEREEAIHAGGWPAVGNQPLLGKEELGAKVRNLTGRLVKEVNLVRIMKARFLMLEKGIANTEREKIRTGLVVLGWNWRCCCELIVS